MDIDPVKKRLVLNGSLGPDLPFKIHVSSSMEPVGPELVDLVENAEISLTDDNNNTIYPQYDSMGFYLADWYPEPGKNYKISVNAPGFEEASVSLLIPQEMGYVSLSKDTMDSTYPFVLAINDPPEEENTYMIRTWCQNKTFRHLWYSNGVVIDDTLIEKKTPVIYSTDELIGYYADGSHIGDEAPSTGEKSSYGFLISDELFNGQEHILRFKVSYIGNLDMDRPYLFVELVSVDREFYDFVKSYSLYYDARGTPFAEPVAILTNVENGLGFVYGYSVHTDSIRLR